MDIVNNANDNDSNDNVLHVFDVQLNLPPLHVGKF